MKYLPLWLQIALRDHLQEKDLPQEIQVQLKNTRELEGKGIDINFEEIKVTK